MSAKNPVQLRGVIGSPGFCRAKAYVFRRHLEIKKTAIAESDIEKETARLEAAVDLTRRDIQAMQKEAEEKHGAKYAAIFDSHVLMLSDPQFIPQVIKRLKKERVNVESIVRETLDALIRLFEQIEDTYLRERAVDLSDVGDRLLRYLLGVEGPTRELGTESFVLVANEVTPSELLEFSRGNLKGICLDSGGATSHVAILAGALGIPSVFGLGDLSKAAHTNDVVLVDTRREGLVMLHPDEASIAALPEKPIAEDPVPERPVTKDGYEPILGANIGRVEELAKLSEYRVRRIGLFRSEFLFMEAMDAPSEQFQEQVYRQVVRSAGDMAVLRVMDVGSDKPVKYFPFPRETNPAMGFRSIRFALSRPDVLLPQLRAMIKAAEEGPTRIIFPMVTIPRELELISDLWKRMMDELQPPRPPEWGIMVEVPAAVFMLDTVARFTKYISLGTNDLLQFFYAVDRMNEKLNDLAHPLCIPFLRMLLYVVAAARSEEIKVGICGEMAGDPVGFLTLLGIGVDEFSMRPQSLNAIKRLIPQISLRELTMFVHDLLSSADYPDVRREITGKFLSPEP